MSRFQPPRPAGEPSRGVVITSESPLRPQRLLPLAGIAGFLVVVFLVVGRSANFVIIIAAIVAIVLALRHSTSIVALFGWQGGSLEIPDRPILLGDDITTMFRRTSRRPRPITECSVQGTLICEEEVRYRQGTDTRTDRHRVFQQTFVGRLVDGSPTDTISGQDPPAKLTASLVVKVPANAGGPSLELPNNRVRWRLEVVTVGPAAPKDVQRFSLVVNPQLAIRTQDDRSDR